MLQLRNLNAKTGGLWLVDERYTLGAGQDCHIKIHGSEIQDTHAELQIDGDQVKLVNLVGDAALSVNGQLVRQSAALQAGDEIALGNERFTLVDSKSLSPRSPERPAQAAVWCLEALNTALANKRFSLAGSQILGRSKDCDISLAVVHLSRRHAQLTAQAGGVLVKDLDSANGTFLNGKKISEDLARDGDELRFDTLRFRLVGSGLPSEAQAQSPDSEKTALRPVLAAPDQQVKAPGKKEPPKSPRKREPQAIKPPMSETETEKPSRDNHAAWIWSGIALALGVVVAFLLLK